MDVGYESAWQDPWEPFFISPLSAPDYDERFRQVIKSIREISSTRGYTINPINTPAKIT